MIWVRRLLLLVVVLLALAGLAAVGGYLVFQELTAPVRTLDGVTDGVTDGAGQGTSGTSAEVNATVIFTVPRGTSGREVARRLEQAGLVRSADAFRLVLRLDTSPGTLRAGEFRLSPTWDARRVLRELKSGALVTYGVTVPEGTDLFALPQLLERADFLARADLNALLWSTTVPRSMELSFPTAEGLLFPETYLVQRGTTTAEVVQLMARHFEDRWNSLLERHGLPEGITEEQALIVASLVETEARVGEERPLVAAVYHNRIRRKMPLQADPTTIYSMKLRGVWGGNIRREDLQCAHPYNTYAVPGMPPGPIAFPGEASLLAALRPADVPYLYFVARNDGTHVFSETYDQHLKAVREYQRRR